jgi:methionyl-tRNA formyltransferase
MTAILNDVALFGADTLRTRTYLEGLRAEGLMPAAVVLLKRKTDKDSHGIQHAAAGTRLMIVETDDINDAVAAQAIAALPEAYVIFSGPGGAIVKKPLFETGKRFLHVHPGRVPEFRGSTTIYYSLLAENHVEATAFFLEEEIDTGPVLGTASFPPPQDRTEIDRDYDSRIRAQLLVSVLRQYKETGRFVEMPQQPAHSGAYYIIHPVLKHLAILAK